MIKRTVIFALAFAVLKSGVVFSQDGSDGNSDAEMGDEDWLNTVWTQVDDMVKEEEYKLQETVTVAGVRGAEAEDNILAKLYYKGGKRYPSQDKLVKAVKTLQDALAKDPKSPNAPKQKFFVAQCYEKMGQQAQALSLIHISEPTRPY